LQHLTGNPGSTTGQKLCKAPDLWATIMQIALLPPEIDCKF
jgi:hypothetical protein